MEQRQEYLQRLADIDALVARARLDPAVVVERAAGLLAGRVGSRVDDAHAYLLRRAAHQGRVPEAVAAELLAALEGVSPAGTLAAGETRFDSTVEQALAPPRRARTPGRPGSSGADTAPDAWARAMQQVVEAWAGNQMVLVPMHDGGVIVDYVIVAASSDLVDFGGRRVTGTAGQRISQAYPPVVGSPVWDAWGAVIGDGQSRRVGPFSYVAESDRSPVQLMITASVHPVGPGVLVRWVRHDEESRLDERIAQTERLGNLGWGEADLLTGQVVWSDQMYHIYERDPALGPLSDEEQNALTLPEDEPIRRRAAEAFGRGATVDVTTRARIGARVKHLRTVVDAVRDVKGRPVRVYGIVQDVTAQETNRAQLAEVEQRLREHQQTLAAEHQLAVQLQQIVLPVPAERFILTELAVAVRYLPAEEASQVGGDWFHAATAEDGSVVLAVGDVAGHGMPAATTMAQLRQMLAGLTITTSTDPAELLAHLNRLVYAGRHTATLVIARYDPATHTLCWAQAGHPPPLHTRCGSTTVLPRPKGPLLGALDRARYATATLTLDPGDLILLYTDGLVEHPDHTPADGLRPVIDTLNRISTSDSRQPVVDLLDHLHRANPADDTCMVAVRRLPHDGQP